MVGRTISHYRIVAPLGTGGMGVVYRGEDTRLGREVAIKFVSEDAAPGEQAVHRLRSEARAASALNHPNICTIYDVGEDEGQPFIVMELMKGQTLRDRLQAGPLKVHQLVDIGIEISDALQATHTDGIIHRDIKPGNIFLTDRGHVKILDFGLAKVSARIAGSGTTYAVTEQTGAGITIGTVSYMSPEQAAGEALDGRTDLFSLGVVLYECATGRHPFPGKTSAVILAAILNKAPVAPVTINPELPLRLQDIINNCLEKDRELRYQSAADLRADLKRLRRDLESGHSRTVEVIAGSDLSRAESRTESGRRPSAAVPARRSGLQATAVGAVAALALAVGLFGLWRLAQAPTASPTTVATPPGADVEGRLSLARSSLQSRNYRLAIEHADGALAIDPTHVEATRIRDEARAVLARFDGAIAQARADLARGDVQAATRSIETARALDPTAPAVSDLSLRLSDLVREREAAARETAQRQAARPAPPPIAAAPVPQPSAPVAPPPAAAVSGPPVSPAPTPVQPRDPDPPPPAASPTPVEQAPPSPARSDPAPAAPAPEPRPAEPSPPAPSRDEMDETAIRLVVASYGRAIETKDLALFRSIKPNLSADEERRLQQGFRAVTSQRVQLTIASLDRRGDAATVVVQRRDVLDVGGRRQTVDARQTLTLTRTKDGWAIVDIR